MILFCSGKFKVSHLEHYLWVSVTTMAGVSTEHTSTSTGKSVLEYNVFSIFMFIVLGKTSTGVVLAPALVTTSCIFTRGQFWPSGIVVACVCVCVCPCVCQFVCQSLACLLDDSGPVQARITKFRPKMQKTLVKVPIVLGGNWPWPLRSNLT